MAKKILTVDDEPGIVDLLVRYLTKSGYTVIGAVGGVMAMNAIKSEPGIDIVITDLKMPEISGIDILKECLKLKIPVIVFTASSGVCVYSEELKQLGYSSEDVLHKPIDMKSLVNAIEKEIEKIK